MGMAGLMDRLKPEGAKYDIKVDRLAPVAGTRLTAPVLPDLVERQRPEWVFPVEAWLCAERCEKSGNKKEVHA